LGVAAALRPNGWIDRLALVIAVSGQAIPSFWLGLMAIVVFGVWYGWVPISGADTWQGYILPVIVLSYYAIPELMRITRSGMIDVLATDYVRAAKAKGLPPGKALIKYPLRMALNPFIADIGNLLPEVISGAAIVSIVLSLPTTGPMLLNALQSQDMYLAGSFLMFLATLTVIGTLISDLALAVLDPRIRIGGGAAK